MSGTPVFEGTRVPVKTVIADVAAGMSLAEITDNLGLAPEILESFFNWLATQFESPE